MYVRLPQSNKGHPQWNLPSIILGFPLIKRKANGPNLVIKNQSKFVK